MKFTERMGLIADIHANLPALRAVLRDAEEMGVDRMICLGDIATLGPHPREATDMVRQSVDFAISGNHDQLAANPARLHTIQATPTQKARRTKDLIDWSAARISGGQRRYLGSLPRTDVVTLADGTSLFCCHGTPLSDADSLAPDADESDLWALLHEVSADLIAAAHTHVPMLRRVGDRLLINPGSVGLAESTAPGHGCERCAPWAEYAIITSSGGGTSLTLRRIPYDTREVAEAAREAGMPHAEWFISHFSGAGG